MTSRSAATGRALHLTAPATYYIKTAADDVRNAMAELEQVVPETAKHPKVKGILSFGTLSGTVNLDSTAVSRTVN